MDDGEGGVMDFKMSPILLPDGVFEKDKILSRLRAEASPLGPELSGEIIRILEEYE